MNDRVRIYELARKMSLDNQVLINAARELGYDIKSHSSTLDSHAVGLIISHLGKKKAQEEAAQQATATKTATKAATGTKSTKAAAAPPPPPVKPRVLARYRRPDPAAEPAEQPVEQAPAAAEIPEGPTVSPAVLQQQQFAAAVAQTATQKAKPTPQSEPVTPKHEPEVAQAAATEAQEEAPVQAEPATPPPPTPRITTNSMPHITTNSPPPVSRAVLEQRAQQEAIDKATEAALKRKEEQARAEAARAAEPAKKEETRREFGDKKNGEGKRPTESRPGDDGGSRPPRDGAFTGQARPSAPSAPAQPTRIGAPSFRATPPRPPKGHNRTPSERHTQNAKKEEKAKPVAAVIEVPKIVAVSGPVTIKELGDKMGVPETEVIKRLFMKGVMRTMNQLVEPELAKELALEMGYELASQEDMEIAAAIRAEEAEPKRVELTEEDIAAQVLRPPVVTIMGHVDHGKTSLLDAIRQTKFLLTDSEHGGITQHIGAYHVEVPSEDGSLRQIVFLDTPGHEAFTAMRARGAKVTDIAILVVAADDGVMPQTIEAIDHAKAAGVPIIVAINKIDKSNADPDRVLTDLMHHGVVPDKFGGDTVTVQVSAKKKTGLDELLEMILLVADIQDLKANPEKPATGTIVEAELSRGKGAVATALVANGTLREGDYIVAGSVYGRVRALFDDRGERVKAAGPSMPVEVLGLAEVPQAGDRFEVVPDSQAAKALAEMRKEQEVEIRRHHVTLESFHDLLAAGEVKELDIIVKADVQGTAEAIAEQLVKLSNPEVQVRILRTASGDISETDVNLAASSKAIIVGFSVQPDNNAVRAAETAGVDIRTYNIIYKIIDDLTLAIKGLLTPIMQESEVGTAEIRQLFKVGKNMMIAGCMVTSGKIPRGSLVRIQRDGTQIYEGKIETLKRFKDDAKEVAAGFECGMSFEKFTDLIEGDIVHAFQILEIKR